MNGKTLKLAVVGAVSLGFIAVCAANESPRHGLKRGDCVNESCQGSGQTQIQERKNAGQGEGRGQFRNANGKGQGWHRDKTGARRGDREGNCAGK